MSQDEATARSLAFQRCYAAQASALHRFIFSKVGDWEEAEDLTATVFVKALRGADWSRDAETLRHWLYQTARTTIVDHWRAVGRWKVISLDTLMADGWEGPPSDDQATAPAPPMAPGLLVAAILDHLPENYRAVLRSRFLERRTIKETALHLGLTETNVKVLQFRALKRAAELRADLSQKAGSSADD